MTEEIYWFVARRASHRCPMCKGTGVFNNRPCVYGSCESGYLAENDGDTAMLIADIRSGHVIEAGLGEKFIKVVTKEGERRGVVTRDNIFLTEEDAIKARQYYNAKELPYPASEEATDELLAEIWQNVPDLVRHDY